MTTVLTRISEIKQKEGFDVWNIKRNGKVVRVTNSGVLRAWPHRNKTRDTHTVKDSREIRRSQSRLLMRRIGRERQGSPWEHAA
jgi:hypothetical protein